MLKKSEFNLKLCEIMVLFALISPAYSRNRAKSHKKQRNYSKNQQICCKFFKMQQKLRMVSEKKPACSLKQNVV
jgi:hypothetical protein